MRTAEDALRSLRRYVASALGSPPWRVRLAMDARFERPFAMVNAPVPRSHRLGGPSSFLEELPIVVQLYPELPSPGPMRTTEARLLAERSAELLTQAIIFGVEDAEDPTVRGYSCRIPLWDYTMPDPDPGAPAGNRVWRPLEGPDSVAIDRLAPDYLLIPPDGWTVDVKAQAAEGQLFVAIANLRVQWYRASRLRDTGTTLQTFGIQYA